ncbi:MAG: hypothetical protein XD95_0076 [Microgenomates bacterium 39_7]|nr:MAG: hypothetical protein XD95_0076 [Microgenomates bacterium 39_7]
MTKIEKLLTSEQRVFTVDDLAVLWNMPDRKKLWESIKYYLRSERLKKIYSGVYVLADREYDQLELAVNLFTPAYISFHTALAIHGVNFQYYSEVHAMALASKKIQFNGQSFVYHQLKDEIFFNELGIEQKTAYKIASIERAVCDTLYLMPSMTFDVLDGVNPNKLQQVAQIYDNKSLIKKAQKLLRDEKCLM